MFLTSAKNAATNALAHKAMSSVDNALSARKLNWSFNLVYASHHFLTPQ